MQRLLTAFVIAAFLGVAAAVSQQNFNTIGGYGNPTPAYPMPVTGNTNVPTYSATVHNFNNSSKGDAFCIGGSATKTVNIKGIRVSAVASAGVVSSISLIRRSSPDSGGGAASVTITPNDTLNAPATASITSYTSAPSVGTQVGIVRSQKLPITTVTSTGLSPSPALFQFSVYWDQPMRLRGASEFLCLDVDSTAGGNWEIDEEHTEDNS